MILNIKPIVAIGILFAVAVAVILSVHLSTPMSAVEPNEALANAACTHFAVPTLTARAAYVYDLTTQTEVWKKNADAQMPLASLTKLMTVFVASRVLAPGDSVAITRDALSPEGDSGLIEGELWRVDDLIDFTLMTSSNDGARALALGAVKEAAESESVFVQRMNTLASGLQLTQTYFVNETGLDISSTTAGAYGSARDMAILAAYIHREARETFEASGEAGRRFTSLTGVTHDAHHTSSGALQIQGGSLFKTGFTDLAGGNLIAIAEPVLGKPVVFVVLGSSREERDHDVLALYNATETRMRRATLCTK